MTEEKRVVRLHQSIAHVLISRSPLHAWQRHKMLGAEPDEATDAKDRGSILDGMLLGGGPAIAVIDAENFRTKAAQDERDAARAAGAIPVLARKHEELSAIAEALRSQLARKKLYPFSGESKRRIEWTDPEFGVACAGELDHVKGATILDLKMTRDASPDAIAIAMVRYGYDIQHAAYTQALATVEPALAGRVKMLFVFAEYDPPYAVTVAEPSGTMRSLGHFKWARACRIWGECLASGIWPGYSDDVVQIEAKPWQLTEAMEEEGDVIEFR